MRTITRTYDLFQLAELSAAARDTAYNEWLRTFEYGWDSDTATRWKHLKVCSRSK